MRPGRSRPLVTTQPLLEKWRSLHPGHERGVILLVVPVTDVCLVCAQQSSKCAGPSVGAFLFM